MNLGQLHKLASWKLQSQNPLIQRLHQFQKEESEGTGVLSIPQNWEEFVRLTTIRSGNKMVVFEPYQYQRIVASLMDKYNNIVVVKSRQLGTTQAATSKFLHRACLNEAYSSCCFLQNDKFATSVSHRARQMLKGLKEYIKPTNDNVGHLKLKGGGEIYFKGSSTEGTRSLDSVSDFLFDEAAKNKNIEEIYASSSPSAALVGDDITKLVVSTPSAKSGWYFEKLSENNGDRDIETICEAVAAGELFCDNLPGLYYFVDDAGVLKLVLHWRCHPVYSQIENYLEYRRTQDGTDLETVLREYDLKFLDSKKSIFSASLVNSCAVGDWEQSRNYKARYYCGLDLSWSQSAGDKDYVCFPVLKEIDGKYSVISIYRERKQTSEYHIYHIAQLIRKFKPDCIGIEITGGVGSVYLEQLSQEFPSIEIRGIHTNEQTKPAMIARLLLAMERQILNFPNDKKITQEFLNFIREGNTLGASSGKHDDIVMSLAFAIAVTPMSSMPEYEEEMLTDSVKKLMEEL